MNPKAETFARNLKQAVERWQNQTKILTGTRPTLGKLAEDSGIPYRRLSRWMTKGLEYDQGNTVNEIVALCDKLSCDGLCPITPADLRSTRTVTLSYDTVEELLTALDNVSDILRRSIAPLPDDLTPDQQQFCQWAMRKLGEVLPDFVANVARSVDYDKSDEIYIAQEKIKRLTRGDDSPLAPAAQPGGASKLRQRMKKLRPE